MKPLSKTILPALALLATTAFAADAQLQLPANMPHRKAGLWVAQIHNSGKPVQTLRMCIDEATDTALYKWGLGISKEMCSKLDVRVEGGDVIADSICSMPRFFGHGGNTITAHGVTHFSGDTAYHTESTVHYDPPLEGKSDGTNTVDAHWTGPCQAGQHPGDIVMSNGATINVKDLAQGPASTILKSLFGHHDH